MADRRALVLNSGLISQLPSGDVVVAGTTATEIIAGSGLSGGGPLGGEPRVDVALAPNPSGLIFVEDALANDGVALATATTASASGTIAFDLSTDALASGNLALETSIDALASGNAALDIISSQAGGGSRVVYTAAYDMPRGTPVGLNKDFQAEPVRQSELVQPQLSGILGSGGVFINPTGMLPPYQYNVGTALARVPYLTYDPRYGDFILSADYANGTGSTILVKAYENGGVSFKNESALTPRQQANSYYTTALDPETNNFIENFQGTSNYPTIQPTCRTENKLYNGTATNITTDSSNWNRIIPFGSGMFVPIWMRTNSTSNQIKGMGIYNYGGNAVRNGTAQNITLAGQSSTPETTFAPVTGIKSTVGTPVNVISYRDGSNGISFTEISMDFSSLEIIPSIGQQVLPYSNLRYMNLLSLDDEGRRFALCGISGNGGNTVILDRNNAGQYSIVSQTVMIDDIDYFKAYYDKQNKLFGYMGAHRGYPTYGYFQPSGDVVTPAVSGLQQGQNGGTSSYQALAYVPGEGRALAGIGGDALVMNYLPRFNSNFPAYPQNQENQSNFIGITNNNVVAGDSVVVLLPGQEYIGESGNWNAGDPLYLSMCSSGLSADGTRGATWSGTCPWECVATATSTSGYVLLNQL